jgi:acyl carrier protein
MSELVFNKVAEIIAENRKISIDEITLESTFRELDIDSLAALSLVFEFEDTFGVEIPNEEVVTIQNVRDIVESLERLGVTLQ